MTNKLNELDGKEWIKFTKSWFTINAKPRSKQEIEHPAKYPEELVEEFIKFFTKKGEIVFDPFLGVGSTIVGAENLDRLGIGIELNKSFCDIAKKRVRHPENVYCGDSRRLLNEIRNNSIDFIMTSPPYWNILRKKRGNSDSQHTERLNKGLKLYYSDSDFDLGNIEDYDLFLNELVKIFKKCRNKLKEDKYMVIVIQNFRNSDGNYMTLAWDLAKKLSNSYGFVGEKIWIQENKKLGIWGFKSTFVPNIHHHYCLIFKKSARR